MAATEAEVVEYLRHELTWPTSPEMFNALFWASPTVTFELVVLIERWSGFDVVLLTRPEDDTECPGMLHVPGTATWLGDTPESALRRLLSKDMKGARLSTLQFAGLHDALRGDGEHECSRGQITQRIYVAKLLKGGTLPRGAVLADVADLPLDKFGWPFHQDTIRHAVEWYESRWSLRNSFRGLLRFFRRRTR